MVRFSASTELMSGLGAPARTAKPMRDRTRSNLAAGQNPTLLDQVVKGGVIHNYYIYRFAALKPARNRVLPNPHGGCRSHDLVPGGAFELRREFQMRRGKGT
jgi:hypothetical protein